ncbi:MAG: queuosine precursor transporter [Candidatus Rariloculaceae bacterium]
MLPEPFTLFFSENQNLLWLVTLTVDLSLTLLMYRVFGRIGLVAAIVLAILLANLQGPKLTVILGMETSLGVIFYSSIFFATDLLGEKHGRAVANQAVLLGFGVSVIIVLMMSMSLLYLPSTRPASAVFSQDIHAAFSRILDFSPRFVFGSLLAYLISQSFDVWLFHRVKQWTEGRHLWLRNNLSTMTSQVLDTVLYAVIVWWGIFDLAYAFQLALAKYVFKVFIAAFDTPFIYWARTWDVPDPVEVRSNA